jgi:hypothetical protein
MGNGLCTADSMLINATSETFTETFPGIWNTTANILMNSLNYEATPIELNMITLCNTVGLEELSHEIIQDLKVYPNPNNGNFNIQLNDQFNEGELSMFDQLGRQVYSGKVFTGTNSISTQGLSAGLYHFIVSENHKPFAKGKFMVQ